MIKRVLADPRATLTLYLLVTITYLFSISRIGYLISTSLFVPLGALLLGYRNYLALFLVTAGWIGFVFGVFVKVLQIPLP